MCGDDHWHDSGDDRAPHTHTPERRDNLGQAQGVRSHTRPNAATSRRSKSTGCSPSRVAPDFHTSHLFSFRASSRPECQLSRYLVFRLLSYSQLSPADLTSRQYSMEWGSTWRDIAGVPAAPPSWQLTDDLNFQVDEEHGQQDLTLYRDSGQCVVEMQQHCTL